MPLTARSPVASTATSGLVFDIRKFAVHDGPGIRTTVFLKGCLLSCWWCHNPESQNGGFETMVSEQRCIRCGACAVACTHGAIRWTAQGPRTDRTRCVACGDCAEACWAGARERVGRVMTVGDVLADVLQDRPFYEESGGGITVSGGEPLLQRDFTAALLGASRERGLHTTLDTCGFTSWETLDLVRRDVDLFLFDVKLMDDTRHRRYTGVPNQRILRNLRALADAGSRIRLRVPVIPGVTDDDANLHALGAFAADLPALDGVDLLPYHAAGEAKYARLDRPWRLPGTATPSAERLAQVARLLASYGLTVGAGAAA